jgi:hypothetical protein
MIALSTIDFYVVNARWPKCGSGKSFVLIHLSRQIELDEPQEVVGGAGPSPPMLLCTTWARRSA